VSGDEATGDDVNGDDATGRAATGRTAVDGPDAGQPRRATDGQAARRGRLSSRTTTIVLAVGVLLGTALVLWGVDWAARHRAESAVADTIQAATGVTARPTVDVHGAFFLPQVVRGVYDDVDITVDGLTSGPLQVDHLQASLTGVHLSFHDVLVQSYGPLYIEGSTERALLSYDDLNAYLAATGRPFTVAAAAQGQAQLTGTVQVLGRDVSVSTQVKLGAQDGELAVQPAQPGTGTALDQASRLLLQQRLSFLVPLDPLPFGQQLTAVDVGRTGLTLSARGSGVVVRP